MGFHATGSTLPQQRWIRRPQSYRPPRLRRRRQCLRRRLSLYAARHRHSPPSLSPNSTSNSSLSPFVTSVRWSPHPLRRDILSHDPSSAASHLLVAAGDRQGRIALLDLRLKSPLLFLDTADSKLGIQDLCWIQSRPASWILAALSGPSHLSLYNTSTGRCFFKYDAAPELFSCIRRDPFDSGHFCALGLRGFLLSVKVLNDNSEDDVFLKELQIPTDSSELQRLERDAATGANPNTTSPSLAIFPTYIAKCAFSPHWRHILFVTFPRELVVFDLRYETALFGTALPRGFGKFFEVLPDPSMELLYCAHLDGKLSTWRRKEGEQVHTMCMMEELMPSIGTSVPSPSVLAVVISLSDSTLQNIGKHCSNISHTPLEVDFDNPFDFYDESLIISKTHLISISDDGKLWNWLLTAEGTGKAPKDETNSGVVSEVNKVPSLETNAELTFGGEPALDAAKQPEDVTSATGHLSNPTISQEEMLFKISLVGQLQLLSSTLTMLAVPSPSLTATLACGGNYPAVTVPLVALGSQSGTIDVIDVSANAVAASFSVHNSVVRGLRWLGNSRLVSFS